MYDLAGENGLDLEALRARLRLMSDDAGDRADGPINSFGYPAVSKAP